MTTSLATSRTLTTMKANLPIILLIACSLLATAEDPLPAEELLRKGLFEEQANQNLDQAEKHYRTLVERHLRERALATTALFRLGEIARKRDHKDAAIVYYQTFIRQFPEATDMVRLARQNLAGLGAPVPDLPSDQALAGINPESVELLRLQRTLRESPDLIDGPDERGWHPLHHAAENGWSQVTAFLIEKKVSLDVRTVSEKVTATHLATIHGHLAIVRQLLDAGTDRHLTCEADPANWLLPPVPDRVERPAGQYSLLDLAITYDRSAVVDLLLAGKPDNVATLLTHTGVNTGKMNGALIPTPVKLTPFQLAIWLNRSEIATKLLKHNAPLFPVSDDQPSALLFAAIFRPAFARWLLENGADPDLGHPASGLMPLHQAIHINDLELAKALLKAGADIKAVTSKGSTPMHFVRSPEAVTLLLANDADINAEQHDGTTPLELIAIRDHDAGARATFLLMIENGATCKDPAQLVRKADLLVPEILEHLVYPTALNPDAITIVDRGHHERVVEMEARLADGVPAPPLADVIAMHRMTLSEKDQRNAPRLGGLRVLRFKPAGGVDAILTARGADVTDATLPELRWGDLVEINVFPGKDLQSDSPPGSPTYDEFLATRVTPRQVAFRFGTVQTVVTVPDRASPDQRRNSWKSINLGTLFGPHATWARPISPQSVFTIQREGVEEALTFARKKGELFRLSHRDRVTYPLRGPDKNAFVLVSGSLSPSTHSGNTMTLLNAVSSQESNPLYDWRRVEVYHASSKGLKAFINVDALARAKVDSKTWSKLDFKLGPGCMIVLHPLPKSASKEDRERSERTYTQLRRLKTARERSPASPDHAPPHPFIP